MTVPADSSTRSVALGVAVVLCWTMGAFMAIAGLIAITLTLSGYSNPRGGGAGEYLALLLFGAAYCFAGFWVRRRTRLGRWLAVVLTSLFGLAGVIDPSPRSLIGLAVNITILGLIIANWQRFPMRLRGKVGA